MAQFTRVLAAAVVLGGSLQVAAQGPPPQGAGAGRQGGAGGNPTATFPAQQRPPGNPALIARGRNIYDISCRSCHGADLRGGDLGGPNLLRSQLVLNDQEGELMRPIIREGRSTPGVSAMPPLALSDDDIRAVADYIHSVLATARGQGAPPPGPPVELDILVGNAAAGRAYFQARCASCHSPTGDLQGIASRIADPKELQNTWVRGRAGRGGGPPSARTQVRVRVTQPSGERVEGRLVRLDDFFVALIQDDGQQRSFTRRGKMPAVEIDDPMAGHTNLLPVYTDADIHNVTAYLVTLK